MLIPQITVEGTWAVPPGDLNLTHVSVGLTASLNPPKPVHHFVPGFITYQHTALQHFFILHML